jgi:conjugation system TraG family ATPase
MNIKKIDKIFPILSVEEEGLVVTKNADLALLYEITYPEIFKTNEYSYTSCFNDLFNAIKNLGEGYIIHKQDFFIKEDYKPNHSYNKNFDPIIRKNELQFAERSFMNHKGYIYIILPNQAPDAKTSLASSLFKSSLISKDFKKGEYLDNFYQRNKSFTQSVNASNLFSIRQLERDEILGSKDKLGLLNYYFTLSFEDKSLHDISMDDEINIGDSKMSTFVINDLNQFPPELQPIVSFRDYSTERTKMPASYGLNFGLNLRCNHIYNQIIYLTKQEPLKQKLVQDSKRHFSFSAWSRDNTYSLEQKTLFMDTIQQDTVAVKVHYNIQVFDKTIKALTQSKSEAAANIQRTGFMSKLAKVYQEQIYWSCIPSNASEIGLDNLSTVVLDNAVAMLNMESNYRESAFQNNGILLTDRFGKPILLDLFFEPLEKGIIDNRNFVVIGPSGSGKSFAMNNAIYYLLSQGTHITIVDVGNSYGRLGEILGAKHIMHTNENPISLNPFYMDFDFIPDDKKLKLEEDFKEVVTKTVTLLFKKEEDKLTKTEEVTVGKMVSHYYDYIHKNQDIYPCFDTFYEFVKDIFPAIFEKEGGRQKEFDIPQFLFVTSIFYKGGDYDYLLNSKEKIDYSKEPFVIYELDNIKDNTVLMPIMTLIITNTYISKLVGVRDTLKMLIMEEAWKAVSNVTFSDFLLWGFKTARKHFGSIGVVSQEMKDLLKSKNIQDAIVSNTAIKWILDLKDYQNKQDEVCRLFELNESELPQIFSINKKHGVERGKFKEQAIKLGGQVGVYGTEVSKHAYALFTTNPKEKDQITAIAQKNQISQKEAALIWADTN